MKYFYPMNKFLVLFFTLVLIHQSSYSQYRSLTSASDIGRLNSSIFSQNRFAGQLSAAYVGNFTTNFQNPASYADATLTAVEVGANSISGTYHLEDSTNSSGGLSINHFSMLFPLTPGKSGLSMGFLRNANTDYSIRKNGVDNTFGSFSNQLKGFGNTYQAYIGTGFRIKNLKLGANLGFIFGQTEHTNDIIFPDSTHIPRLVNRNIISEFGIQYTLGAQYEWQIAKEKQAVLGMYYTSSLSKNGTNELRRQNAFDRSGITEFVILKDSSFNTELPKYSKLGIGASLINNKTTLIGAEFTLESFSGFRSKLTNQNLQDAWHIHLGAEFKPFMSRDLDARKYFNRLTYRAGAVIGKSEQNFEGTVNDIKFMGGATLPVFGRNIGYITLGAEYGIRGFGGQKNQLSENYLSIHMIITFADKWFTRQRFD